MGLLQEMDDLGHESPIKMWNLSLPLRTKLNFVKIRGTEQDFNIMDECPHANFENGVCDECEWTCDHDDIEEYHCLICGKALESYFDDDYYYDQWKERDL